MCFYQSCWSLKAGFKSPPQWHVFRKQREFRQIWQQFYLHKMQGWVSQLSSLQGEGREFCRVFQRPCVILLWGLSLISQLDRGIQEIPLIQIKYQSNSYCSCPYWRCNPPDKEGCAVPSLSTYQYCPCSREQACPGSPSPSSTHWQRLGSLNLRKTKYYCKAVGGFQLRFQSTKSNSEAYLSRESHIPVTRRTGAANIL